MDHKHDNKTESPAYSSNCIRLSLRQWVVTAAVVAVVLSLGPNALFDRGQFESTADHRLASGSSDDYWLFRQWCESASPDHDWLVLGDSAIRGYYVSNDQTLSGYLNDLSSGRSFANLGVDGMHPAALAGLVRHYGQSIHGKRVIVHMNPLWMSSKARDLQSEKERQFHHQKLVGQFDDRIRCYKARWSRRLSTTVTRRVNWLNWASHLRITFFAGNDMHSWTLDHPYEWPTTTTDEPVADDQRRPWTEMDVRQQDMPFVEAAGSVQWSLFKDAVNLLRQRDNEVFVIVGPFNEHMLIGDSVGEYAAIKQTVRQWLDENDVPCCMMNVLGSDLYRDASHPLAGGYEAMARQLFADDEFQSWLTD